MHTEVDEQQGTETPPGVSKDPSPVVYDDLGAGVGQTIGYVEGREATAPFDEPTAIDAINAARPQVLWVGMTAPKQEVWLAENIHRLETVENDNFNHVFDFAPLPGSGKFFLAGEAGLFLVPKVIE